MAVDMFLKLDGIEGESKDAKHAGEIDIESFAWGMAQTGSGHRGTGSGTGKVDVHDITITKVVDKSSPSLMLACANGKHIAKGSITVRRAGESAGGRFPAGRRSGILGARFRMRGGVP